MNKFILGGFLALCCLTAVRGLTCNICSFRVFSFCVTSSSTATCTGSCATTTASLGSVSLFKKLQCLTPCTDGQNGTEGTFGMQYNVACCTVDQCNSASAAKLSLSLGLAVVASWLVKLL